jgi:hypothetical protein
MLGSVKLGSVKPGLFKADLVKAGSVKVGSGKLGSVNCLTYPILAKFQTQIFLHSLNLTCLIFVFANLFCKFTQFF